MKTITVTVSGPQGVGKSTLARILINALDPHFVVEHDEYVPFGLVDAVDLIEDAKARVLTDVKVVFKTEQVGKQCLQCGSWEHESHP